MGKLLSFKGTVRTSFCRADGVSYRRGAGTVGQENSLGPEGQATLLHVAEQRRGQGLAIRGIGNTCFLTVSAFQAESPRVVRRTLVRQGRCRHRRHRNSIVYGGRSARAGATSN